MKIGKIIEETVICHQDVVVLEPKTETVEFRVVISFEDEDGNDWIIDRVYKGKPKRKEPADMPDA